MRSTASAGWSGGQVFGCSGGPASWWAAVWVALPVGLPVGAGEAGLAARMERVDLPVGLSAVHRELLDPRALVVSSAEAPVMRVWFRKAIPVRATEDELRKGLTYRHIPEGTLVGAVELPQTFVDYRKQRIPAGVYTLRFAVQPDTGDHTDTAPHREFCLLSAAAGDRSAGEMAPKELIELSSRLNQGRHPAVLLLWPNEGRDAAVRMLDKGQGVHVVATTRPVVAEGKRAALGFAITVAGFWKQ